MAALELQVFVRNASLLGKAHALSTRIRTDDLPLRGSIGSDAGCSIVLHTMDVMGNKCKIGGANVATHVGQPIEQVGHGHAKSSAAATRAGGGVRSRQDSHRAHPPTQTQFPV